MWAGIRSTDSEFSIVLHDRTKFHAISTQSIDMWKGIGVYRIHGSLHNLWQAINEAEILKRYVTKIPSEAVTIAAYSSHSSKRRTLDLPPATTSTPLHDPYRKQTTSINRIICGRLCLSVLKIYIRCVFSSVSEERFVIVFIGWVLPVLYQCKQGELPENQCPQIKYCTWVFFENALRWPCPLQYWVLQLICWIVDRIAHEQRRICKLIDPGLRPLASARGALCWRITLNLVHWAMVPKGFGCGGVDVPVGTEVPVAAPRQMSTNWVDKFSILFSACSDFSTMLDWLGQQIDHFRKESCYTENFGLC